MTSINLLELVRIYIDRMIDDCGPCIKGFVMDKETVRDEKANHCSFAKIFLCLLKAAIVSMAYSSTDMLHKEVFIFERIDSGGKKRLKHLTAICFLRPISENFEALVTELQTPKYGNYFLCMFVAFVFDGFMKMNCCIYVDFTNFIPLDDLKKISEADEYECVRMVQECYVDYLPINPHLYSLDIPISSEVLNDLV